jgi:hypothetical protein
VKERTALRTTQKKQSKRHYLLTELFDLETSYTESLTILLEVLYNSCFYLITTCDSQGINKTLFEDFMENIFNFTEVLRQISL